ncbi:SULTR4, partial [Symbiodinium pilosum]
ESALPPTWRKVYSGESFKPSSLLPPLKWLPRYVRALAGNPTQSDQEAVGELPYSLKGDLIAGLTVGLMLVPQCLAFALLAGLPVRAGLYSSFAPLVLYAMLGTLRQLQVGPTALISLLTGQALDSVGLLGQGGADAEAARMAGAAQLAMLVGLISLLLGILRFGFVVDFMSHSVMSAFCTASGVIIATSQLKHVLGISMKRHKYWWETASDLVIKLPESDGATIALGFTLLFFLTFMKAWKQAGNAEKRGKHCVWRFFPKRKESVPFKIMKLCADLSSVLCVVIGWVWGRIYVAAGVTSVRPIGDSESEGFIFVLPTFDQSTVDMIVPAAMIAIVGFLETIAVGGKMANEKRYSYDANQELLALGAANIGGAFMAAFPITGGFSRTAVNAMFGATSQFAGALTSVIVVLAVYLIMPVVEVLPLSALAPLIIHGAIGVTDFKTFISTFKANKLDFAIMFLTFAVSLGITVKEGLATGVCLRLGSS